MDRRGPSEGVELRCEHVRKAHAVRVVVSEDDHVTERPIRVRVVRGHDPLQGGFQASGKPFEICDQWLEVLPTDQIVAVEVKYDPKTGLQID